MSWNRGFRAMLTAATALAIMVVGVPVAGAQQTGTVRGTVTEFGTVRPIDNVQVMVEGTSIATLTDRQGRFMLVNVPAGEQTIRVVRLGYAVATRPLSVTAGEVVVVNVEIQPEAIALREIVVTGVAGATERARVPFTVDKLTVEDLPVPALSPGSMIQGKVAGAQVVGGSGRPGAAPSIMLRGPTSIDATGRSQEPLFIVDGVILGESLVDFDALDIESIEVVKGAAAASLYGSRAANGVVQITTRSGRGMAEGSTRYSVRSEFGTNALIGRHDIAQLHPYRLDEHGNFVDNTGLPFDWATEAFREQDFVWDLAPTGGRKPVLAGQTRGTGTANEWNSFQTNPWPGQTFDHIKQFFTRGNTTQHQFAIEGRQGNTNYHSSVAHNSQEGIMLGQQGYQRNSFRLNLDQGLGDNLQLSVRTFYSLSEQDGQNTEGGSGTPMFALTRMPAGVNLLTRNERGELLMRPDHTGENSNPIYGLLEEDRSDERARFLGGVNVRWSPLDWVDVDANVSYDRSNVDRMNFFRRGFLTARPAPGINQGYVFRDAWSNEALNGSLTGTTRFNFGDLALRLQGRYLAEQEHYDYFRASGSNLVTQGVHTLTGVRDSHITRSSVQHTRSEGFFFIGNADYAGRYIFDGLVRRDGSSLFGADNRWHTYYRGSFAYRMAEEPWWFVPAVNEFKLRYSVGTAGGRPAWFAQYETYSILDGQVQGAGQLGNRDLAPEFATEHEAGLELGLVDRVNFTLNYATTETRDQILPVPQNAWAGFPIQWQNAGTLKSNTWEASVEAPVVRAGRFEWQSRLVYDRTRQRVTELRVPPYTYGVPGQGISEYFYMREGEPLGTIYGRRWASSCADLPSDLHEACAGGAFKPNDQGYLVWTGAQHTPQDGISHNLWGTDGPEVRGLAVKWGVPIWAEDENGETFLPIGSTQPDFNLGFANTFNFGGFTLYGLIDATMGVNVYNQGRHWAYFERYAADQDQLASSDPTQWTAQDTASLKPLGYYSVLYSALAPGNSHFVEDGSFVRLREVALRYRFGRDQLEALPGLRALNGVGLSVIGRNLMTWTNYSGYDPEVGFSGGETGSAALARFDAFRYPNFRTVTVGVEVNF